MKRIQHTGRVIAAMMAAICFTAMFHIDTVAQDKSKVLGYDLNGANEIKVTVGLPLPHPFIELVSSYVPKNLYDRNSKGRKMLPVFEIDYKYNLNRIVSFGGSVGYSYYETPGTILSESGNVSAVENTHIVRILAHAAFNWFNREKVRLYTSVGAGIKVKYDNEVQSDQLPSMPYTCSVSPTIDLCAFGISIGKRVFGNIQIGFMSAGIITAGIGYRF